MADEPGTDDVFERIENGQDSENIEEADGADDAMRGRVDDPVSIWILFIIIIGTRILFYILMS